MQINQHCANSLWVTFSRVARKNESRGSSKRGLSYFGGEPNWKCKDCAKEFHLKKYDD